MINSLLNIVILISLSLSIFSCSGNGVESPENHLKRARQYVTHEDFKSAVIEYRNVIQMEPDNDIAHYELGETYMKLHQGPKALKAFKRAATLNTDNLKAQITMGNIHLQMREFLQARTIVANIREKHPENVDALHLLSAIQLKEHNPEAALETLEKAIKIAPENAMAHFFLAYFLTRQEIDLERAEEAFKKAVSLDSSNRNAYMGLCQLYAGNAEWNKVENVLLQVTKTPGIENRKFTDLAHFYESRKKFDLAEKNYLKAIESTPKAIMPHMNLAEYYVRRNQRDKAIKYMLNAITLKKDHPLLLTGLAQIYLQFDMIDEAEDTLDRVLKQHSKYVDAIYQKGRLMMRKSDYSGALNQFDAVIQLYPYNARAYYYRGICLKKQGGRKLPAQELYRAAAGLMDDPVAFESTMVKENLLASIQLDPGLLDAHFMLTNIYLDEKNLLKAREHLEKIINISPDSVSALTLLGKVEILEGNIDIAEGVFQKIVDMNPNYARGQAQLGIIYQVMGKNDSAMEFINKAIKLRPENLSFLQYAVNLLAAQKRYDEAFEYIARFPLKEENNIDHAHILNLKGNIFLKMGKIQSAAAHFKNAIGTNPDFLDPYLALAEILRKNNHITDAMTVYEKILQIAPSHIPTLNIVGYLYDIRGDWDKAETYYKKILEIDPQQAAAANNLAFIITETNGDLNEAFRLVRMAREKTPRDPNVMDTMGWIFYKRGSYLNAVSELEESLSLNPDNALAHYHLGMAYYKLSKFDKAREHIRQALKIDPNFKGMEIARSLLD